MTSLSTGEGITVLVVENDLQLRSEIADAIEAGGAEVLCCPGPCTPDYTCIGARGQRCPLASAADVVVLDLCLAGDELLEGTAAWELMLRYLDGGIPVVALTDEDHLLRFLAEERIKLVPRHSGPQAIFDAVRDVSVESGQRV